MTQPVSCQIGRGGSPCDMGTRSAETSFLELSVAWRGLTTQGPMGQEAKRDIECRWQGTMWRARKRGKPNHNGAGVHSDLPSLPHFCFLRAGLQLPTGLTTYKMAQPVSCHIGRGGSPCNMGMRGAETSSPELSVAWRGLTTQGPMGPRRLRGMLSRGSKGQRGGQGS